VDVAAKVQRSAEQALEDLQFRRKGLAVSLVVIFDCYSEHLLEARAD
jgi:hypothetical protein